MSVILLQEQLVDRLKYWQKIFNLDDWKIVAKIVRKNDMDLSDSQGEIIKTDVSRQAIIHILDHVDFDAPLFEQDMEKTLVHELLHIKMDTFCPSNRTLAILHHQLLDDFSICMVALDRGDYKA